MNYFLVKTEPATYSIDDLKREGITHWDGVHNHQAINVIKSWKVGDRIFIYHSGKESRLVGLGKVVSEPHFDTSDPRGISWVADIAFVKEFSEEQKVSLREIKYNGQFDDFSLVRQGRLSVMSCTSEFVEWLQKEKKVPLE